MTAPWAPGQRRRGRVSGYGEREYVLLAKRQEYLQWKAEMSSVGEVVVREDWPSVLLSDAPGAGAMAELAKGYPASCLQCGGSLGCRSYVCIRCSEQVAPYSTHQEACIESWRRGERDFPRPATAPVETPAPAEKCARCGLGYATAECPDCVGQVPVETVPAAIQVPLFEVGRLEVEAKHQRDEAEAAPGDAAAEVKRLRSRAREAEVKVLQLMDEARRHRRDSDALAASLDSAKEAVGKLEAEVERLRAELAEAEDERRYAASRASIAESQARHAEPWRRRWKWTRDAAPGWECTVDWCREPATWQTDPPSIWGRCDEHVPQELPIEQTKEPR